MDRTQLNQMTDDPREVFVFSEQTRAGLSNGIHDPMKGDYG